MGKNRGDKPAVAVPEIPLLQRFKDAARRLQLETYALVLAYKDRRSPWYAKALAAVVVAYAFSPIDLIPDVVPVLGYLDDIILVPAGIRLAIRMIPPEVMADARKGAKALMDHKKLVSWWGAAAVIVLWLAALALVLLFLLRVTGVFD